EDSLPLAPELPLVSPFLCFDDSEVDSESKPADQRLERHKSLVVHDAMVLRWRDRVTSRPSSPSGSSPHNTFAPSSEFPLSPVVAPPRIHRRLVILIRPGEAILFGLPYRTHPNRSRKLLTARKRVRPFPARRLALRRVSDRHSSPDFTSDSSSSGSYSDSLLDTFSGLPSDSLSNTSSVHSSGFDASGQSHLGPSTRVASSREALFADLWLRFKQHAEEALIHKTMEGLRKIMLNRPFLKEFRQSNEYTKFIKDLVANKPLTMEDEDVRINHRCSTLLLNQLPPKEKDPGSFILPCSIGRLDFNNALADLGASISIMPFSMYKHLGIGKLETIKMKIELADNSKCIPKGIVRNLLIKIDKFILPIDFIILDVLEDFRMPVILGRPLLTTTHAKVDVFKRSISLEVGNKKVIFKLKSNLPDMKNGSVLMIQGNIIIKEDELMNIEADLFTCNTNTCESCQILAVDTNLFTYEENHTSAPRSTDETKGQEAWASCNPSNEECDGASSCNNEIQCYWKSENDNNRTNIEWNDLRTSDDDDDIEGIIDYLEPMSYDGFLDLDEEEYNKRRCKLLGMSYI
ncbi:hypothetical protein Tco_1187938, partial [Tanacetum coccineum]